MNAKSDKKALSNMSQAYEPSQYEPMTYAMWEASGAFQPTGKGEPFCVIMPPPNANGDLHVGHTLGSAIQDLLTRYHRMKGRDAIYIPGADHAGFETWVVYEKELAKRGKTRFDYSREELYGQVWDYVEARRGDMNLQLRALGVSADWNSLVFTLDEKVIDTVYETFHKLWQEGNIYRGERIVNYCTKHQTSFADIEVTYKEKAGKLYYVAYPLLDKIGEIVVATTRPETMLGDTAIAVNPNDERYKELIGVSAQVPLVNREIPIIADEAVDPEFGTGAVKVTPAHDPLDFEIGQRHNLPTVEVINAEGRITSEASPLFADRTVEDAREVIVRALDSEEMLKKVEDYRHSVGHCYRCGTVIEPLIKDQWFVKVQDLANRAVEAIERGDIAFTPSNKGKQVVEYLKGLKDWNISRQIPWGIPIPAFRDTEDHNNWIFDTRVDQETIEVDGKTYRREEDTFDTWFSSSQWPFITTDYLENGELKRFYPNSLMETASDILYPWVARMIMMGLYRTGQVPFKEVYLHGLVLDEKGQKMSKSRGNVINPMEVIGRYGSDALRLGVVMNRSAGQNQAFSTATVVAGRNFCNKLWNIGRLIIPQISDFGNVKPEPVTEADHWVIRQLDEAGRKIEDLLEQYRFAEAADTVYHAVWDDVADWYIEASKLGATQSVQAWVLETILKLAHPFAPFVSETIWSVVEGERQLLIESPWPKKQAFDAKKAEAFDQIKALVTEVRFVANELPGANSKQTLLYEGDLAIGKNLELIKHLTKLGHIEKTDKPTGIRLAIPGVEAWLKVDEKTLYERQDKLEARLGEVKADILRLEGRLANEAYVKQAPKKVVEETKTQLQEKRELEARLGRELEAS